MISRRQFLAWLGTSTLGAMALAGYAVAIEPLFRLRITRYRLSPPRWPGDLKLRVVVLADFHFCRPWVHEARIQRIVDEANALKPDLILLLGDFLAGMRFKTSHVAPDVWSALLAKLKAPLGVHAVLGNHDWWDDTDFPRRPDGDLHARAALLAVKIPVYENDAVLLEKDGRRFWLAGLGDQIAFEPSWRRGTAPKRGIDDLPGLLARISGSEPLILMAHEPDIFPRVPERVALTLSGHTHGGQIRLFGYSPVVPSRYGNRFAYGHVVEEGRHLIVSGGLGCSIFPVRFGSPPEIVAIDLGDGGVT